MSLSDSQSPLRFKGTGFARSGGGPAAAADSVSGPHFSKPTTASTGRQSPRKPGVLRGGKKTDAGASVSPKPAAVASPARQSRAERDSPARGGANTGSSPYPRSRSPLPALYQRIIRRGLEVDATRKKKAAVLGAERRAAEDAELTFKPKVLPPTRAAVRHRDTRPFLDRMFDFEVHRRMVIEGLAQGVTEQRVRELTFRPAINALAAQLTTAVPFSERLAEDAALRRLRLDELRAKHAQALLDSCNGHVPRVSFDSATRYRRRARRHGGGGGVDGLGALSFHRSAVQEATGASSGVLAAAAAADEEAAPAAAAAPSEPALGADASASTQQGEALEAFVASEEAPDATAITQQPERGEAVEDTAGGAGEGGSALADAASAADHAPAPPAAVPAALEAAAAAAGPRAAGRAQAAAAAPASSSDQFAAAFPEIADVREAVKKQFGGVGGALYADALLRKARALEKARQLDEDAARDASRGVVTAVPAYAPSLEQRRAKLRRAYGEAAAAVRGEMRSALEAGGAAAASPLAVLSPQALPRRSTAGTSVPAYVLDRLRKEAALMSPLAATATAATAPPFAADEAAAASGATTSASISGLVRERLGRRLKGSAAVGRVGWESRQAVRRALAAKVRKLQVTAVAAQAALAVLQEGGDGAGGAGEEGGTQQDPELPGEGAGAGSPEPWSSSQARLTVVGHIPNPAAAAAAAAEVQQAPTPPVHIEQFRLRAAAWQREWLAKQRELEHRKAVQDLTSLSECTFQPKTLQERPSFLDQWATAKLDATASAAAAAAATASPTGASPVVAAAPAADAAAGSVTRAARPSAASRNHAPVAAPANMAERGPDLVSALQLAPSYSQSAAAAAASSAGRRAGLGSAADPGSRPLLSSPSAFSVLPPQASAAASSTAGGGAATAAAYLPAADTREGSVRRAASPVGSTASGDNSTPAQFPRGYAAALRRSAKALVERQMATAREAYAHPRGIGSNDPMVFTGAPSSPLQLSVSYAAGDAALTRGSGDLRSATHVRSGPQLLSPSSQEAPGGAEQQQQQQQQQPLGRLAAALSRRGGLDSSAPGYGPGHALALARQEPPPKPAGPSSAQHTAVRGRRDLSLTATAATAAAPIGDNFLAEPPAPGRARGALRSSSPRPSTTGVLGADEEEDEALAASVSGGPTTVRSLLARYAPATAAAAAAAAVAQSPQLPSTGASGIGVAVWNSALAALASPTPATPPSAPAAAGTPSGQGRSQGRRTTRGSGVRSPAPESTAQRAALRAAAPALPPYATPHDSPAAAAATSRSGGGQQPSTRETPEPPPRLGAAAAATAEPDSTSAEAGGSGASGVSGPLLLNLEVQLAPGYTVTVPVHANDEPSSLAARFVRTHGLDTAPGVVGLLTQLIQRNLAELPAAAPLQPAADDALAADGGAILP